MGAGDQLDGRLVQAGDPGGRDWGAVSGHSEAWSGSRPIRAMIKYELR